MVDEIKKLIGPTWFDVENDDDDSVSLSTREHGDVGEEEPGQEDIDEARRILRAVNASSEFKATADVCDEWVSIEITKKQ